MNSFIIAIIFFSALALGSGCPFMHAEKAQVPAQYGNDLQKYVNLDQSISRSDKLAASLQKGHDSAYPSLPGYKGKTLYSPMNALKFSFEDMSTTFDRISDDLPKGRKKYIHPLGTVSGAQFVPTASHSYTGMFKGADSCLIRLSLASDPSKGGFTPAMAMKCFADGNTPSANFIAMFSLDGQGTNYNIFQNTFSNIIAPPTGTVMKSLEDVTFRRASRCPPWLSLHQFAALDQLGNQESPVSHPVEIWLVPGDIQFPTKDDRDFRNDLATVPVGSTLWTVEISDTKGGKRSPFGKIVTTTKFVASSWADDVLFFQHTPGEVDDCPRE